MAAIDEASTMAAPWQHCASTMAAHISHCGADIVLCCLQHTCPIIAKVGTLIMGSYLLLSHFLTPYITIRAVLHTMALILGSIGDIHL